MSPRVLCVMLVNGRPEMVKRAIRCFREQTYQNLMLYILDSGDCPVSRSLPDKFSDHGIVYHNSRHPKGRTVGALRNYVMQWHPASAAEIIVHWDSDDVSHPRRIEEQVALLQASGKECVGYRDMLFWREPLIGKDSAGTSAGCPICVTIPCICSGQAWLYTNHDSRYCLGTSLCYWRSAWEARPFPDAPKPGGSGEDVLWLREIDSMGVVSKSLMGDLMQPRMIASIHGGNTSTQYADIGHVESPSWKRVPEWDNLCREKMQL